MMWVEFDHVGPLRFGFPRSLSRGLRRPRHRAGNLIQNLAPIDKREPGRPLGHTIPYLVHQRTLHWGELAPHLLRRCSRRDTAHILRRPTVEGTKGTHRPIDPMRDISGEVGPPSSRSQELVRTKKLFQRVESPTRCSQHHGQECGPTLTNPPRGRW